MSRPVQIGDRVGLVVQGHRYVGIVTQLWAEPGPLASDLGPVMARVTTLGPTWPSGTVITTASELEPVSSQVLLSHTVRSIGTEPPAELCHSCGGVGEHVLGCPQQDVPR